MPLSIHPLAELPQILPLPARLAGLDIGTKTIGIALSTPDWQMVTPLKTIKRTKWTQDLLILEAALKDYAISGLIVGLPLNMDDSEGPQAQSVKQVVFNLIKTEPKWLPENAPICFVDERLSTSKAKDTLKASRKKTKASGALDALAAQFILQDAIDFLLRQKK